MSDFNNDTTGLDLSVVKRLEEAVKAIAAATEAEDTAAAKKAFAMFEKAHAEFNTVFGVPDTKGDNGQLNEINKTKGRGKKKISKKRKQTKKRKQSKK
tara:strand:+ start:30 stop:323 length:294 start_codon:yes stop_codon:yes gene_type:complete